MKVLVIDDSVDFSSTIAEIIKSLGLDAQTIHTPGSAINYLKQDHINIDLILLDVEFGFSEKLNGLDLLDIFSRNYPAIPVVMITGKGTIETAVRATKLGAINFIEKNIITKSRIKGIIDTILNDYDTIEEDINIIKLLESCGIIGKSKIINEIKKAIIRYANTNLNVLITGKTGTGKKLVASTLHQLSNRNKNKLIVVDIPNLTDNFREELFGSVSNNNDKSGLFQEANKGTLFLDKIDELSMELQLQLLTPVGDKQIRKVNATNIETLDLRFISTATKDLSHLIKNGYFSEQLYHRLRECEIHLPSIESHKEDIPHIVNYYTYQYNHDQSRNKYFTPSSIDYLMKQQWNGNVRELQSFVSLCLQSTKNDALEVPELTKLMQTHKTQTDFEKKSIVSLTTDKTLKENLAEADKLKIEDTLIKTAGNVSKAAALLDVSRETLHIKIRKYNINVKEYRNSKQVINKK